MATALAIATKYGAPSIYNPGPRASRRPSTPTPRRRNNNGSAFAGFTGFVQPNAPGNVGAFGITFADLLGGVAMLAGRFLPLLAALAVAGSLATKRVAPAGAGTFRTDTPDVRVPAHLVVVIVGGAHLLPRPAPRPGRPGPDPPALLTCARDLITSVTRRSSCSPSSSGSAYPLATTGIAQVLFPNKADGSQVERDGKVGWASNARSAQELQRASDPRYFQSRPSVTGYNPAGTFFNNLGPEPRGTCATSSRRTSPRT